MWQKKMQWSVDSLYVGAGAYRDTAFSETSTRQDYLSTKRSRFPTTNCGQKSLWYGTLQIKSSVDSTILVQHLYKKKISK